MAQRVFTKEDWLDGYESESSKHVAIVAYNMFERFCDGNVQGRTKQYQLWFSGKDTQSICQDLKAFTKFLSKDHPEIILNPNQSPTPFKKKTPMTIRLYFSFIRSYLRQCFRIKLDQDDIKDFVRLPKMIMEERRPIEFDTLKKIFFASSAVRRTLYCVLISSGMRIGEALALRLSDIHLDEKPTRISIRKETTKTRQARTTFITWEATDMLKEIIPGKTSNDRVFTEFSNNRLAVQNEEQYFFKLRGRMGQKAPEMLEKYPGEDDENGNPTYGCRYIVNIHAMRGYFHTRASQKHGEGYANALDGHRAYLKQYYRLTQEERAEKYLELEPYLLVEKYKPKNEKLLAEKITNLEAEFQAYKERQEIINKERQGSSF